jgi:mannosyltransferase
MSRTTLFLLLAILLLATALRFHRLDAQSFWNDEGNSARLSERSIPLILAGTASDVHPPLYYLLLRGWRELAGQTEFSLRALSAFAGVLVVAAAAGLTRSLQAQLISGAHGRAPTSHPVLLATLLAAIHPALIYYSQEARMYQLMALLGALSTLFLLAWYRAGQKGQPALATGWAAAYIVGVAAGLYTHYFFPAVVAAHGLAVILLAAGQVRQHQIAWQLRSPRAAGVLAFNTFPRSVLKWLLAVFAAVMLYLPWLPIFLERLSGSGRGLVRGPLVDYLAAGGQWLLVGTTYDGSLMGVLFLAALLLLLPLVWPPRSAKPVMAAWSLPLLLVAVPLLFLFGGGLVRAAYFKFLLPAVPPLCAGLALGWQRAYGAGRPRLLSLAGLFLVLLLLGGNSLALANLYYNPAYARADYRALASRIATERHPAAAVILNAPNQWEVFTYYHREGAPVYPLPRTHPDPAVIDAELREITARHRRLYAIFWGEAERDPERLVERWLDSHTFKAADEWAGDVRFVVYAVPQEPVREMATATEVLFGDQVLLNGFTLVPERAYPGDIVQVALYWQALKPLEQRYKVFLHLVDGYGRLLAQRDSEPGGGLKLTTIWEPGETVVDQHGVLIPVDAPHGRYALLLGLYDMVDPAARLLLTSGGSGDAFHLGTIEVGQE